MRTTCIEVESDCGRDEANQGKCVMCPKTMMDGVIFYMYW